MGTNLKEFKNNDMSALSYISAENPSPEVKKLIVNLWIKYQGRVLEIRRVNAELIDAYCKVKKESNSELTTCDVIRINEKQGEIVGVRQEIIRHPKNGMNL